MLQKQLEVGNGGREKNREGVGMRRRVESTKKEGKEEGRRRERGRQFEFKAKGSDSAGSHPHCDIW